MRSIQVFVVAVVSVALYAMFGACVYAAATCKFIEAISTHGKEKAYGVLTNDDIEAGFNFEDGFASEMDVEIARVAKKIYEVARWGSRGKKPRIFDTIM